jgi:catechol 2,3-dioxygenase-like lactoylglutathione lyase family enzyme
MRTSSKLIACAILLLSPTSTATAQPAPITIERFGLYAVTDDLDRAATFYQQLFGEPQVRVPGMIGFDVAGGLYAVVDRKTFAATATRGDTTRGYIKVSDMRAAYDAVIAVVPNSMEGGVTREGRFSFFRIRDPDGYVIEFYAVDGGR